MSLWFRRISGLDSETMREIADSADVSWSAEAIVYRGNGIGYADGDPDDSVAIQTAAESVIGFSLVEIDSPPGQSQSEQP